VSGFGNRCLPANHLFLKKIIPLRLLVLGKHAVVMKIPVYGEKKRRMMKKIIEV